MIYKKILFSLLLSSLFIWNAIGQAPSNYYTTAEGLTGFELKTALHNIIDNHNDHGYDGLYGGYETTDTDSYYENDGTILDMYSENPSGSDPYNYTHGNNQCGNYSTEGDCYNREHLFPQGFFNEASPMKSDIHFVVPSDGKVNGMRSNYPFGETNSPSWTSLNGSKRGSCSFPGYSGTIFEPIDEFKGDIARALFYFATRYEDQLSGFDPHNSNNPLDGSSDQAFEDWHVNLLISWHQQDPVSQREIDRNNAAYDYQNNRNPYIDHPEWVECVWLGNCNVLQFTSDPITSVQEGQNYMYQISVESEEGSTLTISCPTQPTWLDFTQTGNTAAVLSGTPNGSNVGEHDVSLSLSDGTTTVYQNFNITVSQAGEVVIFNKDFDDQSLTSGGWTSYSIAGAQTWEVSSATYGHNNTYCGYMNGYDNGAVENEDWLVSPLFVPDNYLSLNFSFWNTSGYGGPTMQAYYSLNFNDNPATADWTEITEAVWHNGIENWVWTFSGDIDMSNLSGAQAHIAFKYTSTNSEAATWEIDDIMLDGQTEVGINQAVKHNFTVYPNPVSTQITLGGLDNECDIRILSIDGKEIMQANMSETNATLKVEHLPNGLYFIQIQSIDKETLVLKFIKQ